MFGGITVYRVERGLRAPTNLIAANCSFSVWLFVGNSEKASLACRLSGLSVRRCPDRTWCVLRMGNIRRAAWFLRSTPALLDIKDVCTTGTPVTPRSSWFTPNPEKFGSQPRKGFGHKKPRSTLTS